MSERQVFISYSHADADRDWVRTFAESLQQQGVKVWLEELEIPAGEPLRDAIEQGLRSSDIIVHIVTPESLGQPNLFFEIGAAVSMGKRLVAVLPRGFEPSLLPQPLRTRRFLIQESPEKTAKELLAKTIAEEHPPGKRS
jgi:TIR domain